MHGIFTLLSSFLCLLLKKSDCVRKTLRILPCGVQGRLFFVFTIIVISVLLLIVFVAASLLLSPLATSAENEVSFLVPTTAFLCF
jgi:hypothetical protein